MILLIGLNVLLGSMLLLETYSLPGANAQVAGLRGDFACVTAKPLGQTYDVLYILDVPDRKLHAFYVSGARRRQFVEAPPRDLVADFGR